MCINNDLAHVRDENRMLILCVKPVEETYISTTLGCAEAIYFKNLECIKTRLLDQCDHVRMKIGPFTAY